MCEIDYSTSIRRNCCSARLSLHQNTIIGRTIKTRESPFVRGVFFAIFIYLICESKMPENKSSNSNRRRRKRIAVRKGDTTVGSSIGAGARSIHSFVAVLGVLKSQSRIDMLYYYSIAGFIFSFYSFSIEELSFLCKRIP